TVNGSGSVARELMSIGLAVGLGDAVGELEPFEADALGEGPAVFSLSSENRKSPPTKHAATTAMAATAASMVSQNFEPLFGGGGGGPNPGGSANMASPNPGAGATGEGSGAPGGG